jgi:hypothetical protein
MSQVLPIDAVAVSPRRAYITTSAYNTDLYTYTVTTNPTTFVKTGTLAANVTGATASTCPPNRILRENGKRLYPDANPQISTLMVGVYDAVSGLSGFIDPNAPKFAIYNSDKANYIPNGIDPTTGLTDRGAPVFTAGTVTAGGTITAQTNVNISTGMVVSTGQIRSSAVTSLGTFTATGNADLNPALGQVFTLTLNTATGTSSTVTIRCHDGTNAIVPPAGSVVYVVVTSTAVGTGTTVAGGTNIKMVSITGVASRTFGIVLVSDGTNLVQVGGDVAATAMA